jgi:hypothetical protein
MKTQKKHYLIIMISVCLLSFQHIFAGSFYSNEPDKTPMHFDFKYGEKHLVLHYHLENSYDRVAIVFYDIIGNKIKSMMLPSGQEQILLFYSELFPEGTSELLKCEIRVNNEEGQIIKSLSIARIKD